MVELQFRIYVSKHGNVFMSEIASLVGCALVDLGYRVELLDSGLPALEPDIVNLVVAPHEYFLFLRSYSQDDRLEASRNCLPITTEQPSTSWFEESVKYSRESRCIFDINASSVTALA